MVFLQLFSKRDTCVLTDLITKNNEKKHKTVIDGQGHNLLRIAYIWLMSLKSPFKVILIFILISRLHNCTMEALSVLVFALVICRPPVKWPFTRLYTTND